MRMSLRLTAVLLCASLGWRGLGVAAQSAINFPQCNNTGLQWAFNSESQNPCQVAAILQGSCFGGTWNIPPISPGRLYGGPSSQEASNVCQCNTVVYSLVAACSACQDGPFSTWTAWKFNCTSQDITITDFPRAIPGNTSVPAWAYLNVTAMGNIWDVNAANAIAKSGSPDKSAGYLPSSSMTVTVTPTASAPSASNSTTAGGDNTTSGSSSKSSKAGPIAGGVVGGLVGLAALALMGFILYRRSYRPKHTTEHRNEKVDISDVASPVSGTGPNFYSHFRSPSDDPPKLYNPSDPSTFPPSPPPLLPGYSPQSPVGSSFSGQGSSNHWAPMNYKGAPEV